MNTQDPFEERLRRQQPRRVPSEWRDEILTATHQACLPRAESPGRHFRLAWLLERWLQLLWPNPKAWAGLAAVWFLIFVMNFSPGEAAPAGGAMQAALTQSPEIRELLRQQEELFAELVGPDEPAGKEKPEWSAPRPHGRRTEESVNV